MNFFTKFTDLRIGIIAIELSYIGHTTKGIAVNSRRNAHAVAKSNQSELCIKRQLQ